MIIRAVNKQDCAAVAQIYNHYVEHTTVTFEEMPVTAADIWLRVQQVQQAGLPWLVLEIEDEVLGYAYASPWKTRSAYRFSVETTVYLADKAKGQGLGTLLYQALFSALKHGGIHTAIGGITLPNDASIALHEKLGMKKMGQFEQVGYKFNQWLDVGYWQCQL
ncbi:arsinothricin resistance N-acetyltransferase ArsN1 family B [Neptunicella marina]|uniref:N-acetyltransferase n=1 Tax=Neptunicella marina TaxID=2125989 RepID=A0A8J6LWI3_9ALTE|nr:arsinothricin resistance N-acetyltransferase ArsN1 family B [Neptunicella marina]MBC3765204.1 N-acetyltransferase [Neptunicella marina]